MSTPTNRQVNIYINQASAERALEGLQKKADKLNVEIDKTRKSAEDLTKNIEKLGETHEQVDALSKSADDLKEIIEEGKKAGEDMTAEIISLGKTNAAIEQLAKKADRLTTAIEKGKTAAADAAKKTGELAKTKESIERLTSQINGGLAPSFSQVKARVFELRREIEGMSKDAPEYAAKFAEFEQVTKRFNEMGAEIRSVGQAMKESEEDGESFLDKVKAIALGTIVGNTVQAALEKVGGYFSGIISGNAQLSDSLADVRKATGLTDEEVKKLNSSLGKIDTRTGSEELRKIAVGLGQIGEAATPEAIASIDKIVVALGDEFGGGAQEITTTLGVLRNNLQDVKTGNYGEDVLRIGNALNELGAAGLATAPVVVDFANRMSGIAGTFKATSGQILGLAAAMQELGIPAERGSTAVTRLLQAIASDTEKFARVAKYAGLSAKEFGDLVNTDIVGALTKVAEGAKKAGVDNQTFGKILKDLDADGSGAGEVLGKLAASAELVSTKISLASKALQETNSVSDEFNLKNTNMAAQLAKLEKAFSRLITSPAVNGFVQKAVDVAVVMVKVLSDLFAFVGQNVTAFTLWGAAILLQTTAVQRLVTWTGTYLLSLRGMTAQQILSTIAFRADTAATSLAAAAKALFAGNVALARREWQLATAAMGINPLTAILIVAGAAAIALNAFISKTKELTAEQRVQDELAKKVTDDTTATISKVQVLTATINNQKLSLEQRGKAYKELIALSPEYLKGLTLENAATAQGKKLLDEYIASLRKKAEEEALASYRAEQLKRQFDAEQNAKRADKQSSSVNVGGMKFTYGIGDSEKFSKEYIEATENLAEVDRRIKANLESQAKKSAAAGPATGPKYTSATDDKAAAAARKKLEREAEERRKRMEAYNEELRQLQADLNAAAISQDALELQRISDKYKKLREKGKQFYSDAEVELQLSGLEQQELRQKIAEQEQKKLKEDYKKKIEEAANHFNELRALAKTKDELLYIDSHEADAREQIARNYANKGVKDAVDDVNKYEVEAVKKRIADTAAAEEQGRRDKVSMAEVAVLVAPRGSNQELEAQKALLRARYEAELENAQNTAADKAKIEAQYQKSSAELEKNFLIAKANEYIQYAQSVSSVVGAAMDYFNQRDQQAINSDRAANDAKKKALQKRYDAGRISRASFDKQIAKLDDEQDKKEKELKLKQFKRNKALSLIQAVINTAQAVTSALAAPWPASIIFAALAAATGAFQVATIASSKPPEFAKGRRPQGAGGVPDGPSHANDGIKLVNSQTGEVVGEMEGDEPILSKETYRNNKEVVDQLLDSSMKGGGKRIAQPSYLYAQPRALNASKVTETMQYVTLYRNGGLLQPSSNNTSLSAAPAGGQPFPADAVMAVLQKLSGQLDEGIKSSLYWNEIDEKNRQHDQLKKTASFNALA